MSVLVGSGGAVGNIGVLHRRLELTREAPRIRAVQERPALRCARWKILEQMNSFVQPPESHEGRAKIDLRLEFRRAVEIGKRRFEECRRRIRLL